MTAAHSLRLLGNSERGIHQTLWRQLYYGAILPITLYSLPLYWKSWNGQILNHLKRLQNKCLHLITGAFKTTPSIAMEIEMSIPPIDLYLEYKPEVEALCLSWLDNNHPIIARTPPNHHWKLPGTHPPPTPIHRTHLHQHKNPPNLHTLNNPVKPTKNTSNNTPTHQPNAQSNPRHN